VSSHIRQHLGVLESCLTQLTDTIVNDARHVLAVKQLMGLDNAGITKWSDEEHGGR